MAQTSARLLAISISHSTGEIQFYSSILVYNSQMCLLPCISSVKGIVTHGCAPSCFSLSVNNLSKADSCTIASLSQSPKNGQLSFFFQDQSKKEKA